MAADVDKEQGNNEQGISKNIKLGIDSDKTEERVLKFRCNQHVYIKSRQVDIIHLTFLTLQKNK